MDRQKDRQIDRQTDRSIDKWNLTSIIQLENGETEDKCNNKKNTKGLDRKTNK